jgi:hypothetical protein
MSFKQHATLLQEGAIMNAKNVSRRTFFKKAAAAVSVVAAADYAITLISESSDSASLENGNYSTQNMMQRKLLSQKKMVIMTDAEKEQRLNEMLNNYRKDPA